MSRVELAKEDRYREQTLTLLEATCARAALGDEGYEAAVRHGEDMPRDEVIELALSSVDTSAAPDEQAPSR